MNRVLFCVALLVFAQSCFLLPKKKSGNGGPATTTTGLIVKDGMLVDRTGDGDSLRLNFHTTRPAACELSVSSQDANGTPSKDKPLVVACSLPTQGRTEITEKIDGLKTDQLYDIMILAWDFGGNKAAGESVLVKEQANTATTVTPGTGTQENGKVKDLIVARFDIPLHTAEVHHNELTEALDMTAIKGKLTRTAGCQVGVPDKNAPFRDAAKDVTIRNLATKDFAAGTAGAHKDYPERLTLNYAGLNEGLDRWSLLYKVNAKDFMITASPISRILNMEMSSTAAQAFQPAQLAEANDALTIDPTKPLKLSWTTGNNLLELSYVTVQIGRPEDPKAIYCIFPADKRAGEIDAALLQGLEAGKYVVLAELTTNQLFAKEGWLVSIYDWRSGRIEK